MAKHVVTLILGFLTVVNADVLSPRDLADEAQEQLDELRSVVQGDILAAHDNLNDYGAGFDTQSVNAEENGRVKIDQQHDSLEAQLIAIKDLANGANADITACTDANETVLDQLSTQVIDQLTFCISLVVADAKRILRDAVYTVDIAINEVELLQFQLNQCNRDMLCISPLVTEIELGKVRVPQNIKTQVETTENILEMFKINLQNCQDNIIAAYVADSGSILADIVDCVDGILN